MATNHILLLGAHGRVSQMMIPLFLKKSWAVTAMIRDAKQKDEMLKLKNQESDSLDFLVHSLNDIKTVNDANEVIKKASAKKPVNWIVWSAGAAGKQGLDGTIAIDAKAAIQFADAATHNDQIERYLTISAINARNSIAEWWSPEDRKSTRLNSSHWE